MFDYKTLRLYNPLCACPIANGNQQNLYVILPSQGFLDLEASIFPLKTHPNDPRIAVLF